MRRRVVLPLCAVLSSCVVGGFDIREHLPGDGAGGTSDSAGASGHRTAGASSGGSSGGSADPIGGDAQGGDATQAGSAPLGGQGVGGDPALPEGGEGGAGGAGGQGTDGPKAALACDLDELAKPPIFCDDFEKVGTLDTQKWQQLPGVGPESASGPRGTTGLIHLNNVRLRTKLPVNLDLAAAGGGSTVSFWAKTSSSDTNAMWADFGTTTNPDVRLNEDAKGLFWRSVQSIRAPSISSGPGITLNTWNCVSIYLTASTMTVSYVRANSTMVTTFVVDTQATPNVDAEWLSQSADLRTIATFIGLGSDPIEPADLVFDDLRIVHGKSNVCGL